MLPLAERIAEARRLLHGHYGFQDFRPLQRRVVQSVLAGRNTLAILPTGGGKSICFQVPGLVLGGLTIVISPLLALMQDQVAALKRRGLPADTLNSLSTPEEAAAILSRIGTGEVRLLYVSPERAPRLGLDLRRLNVKPALLAIDEAHCITEWGHDFRPAYRQLALFLEELGHPQVVALTGSATSAVREDIALSLRLGKHDLHLGSFDRPNLSFSVLPVRGAAERLPRVRELLSPRQGLSIVYVPTRNTADALAQALWFAGHRTAAYHAGLARERRSEVLGQFIAEELDVVVATSAFGMGIDAPRVRLVVHWGMPPTPEAYYQEAGRAGRDGHQSRCVLLYHPADPGIHRRQIEVTFPPRRTLEELWEHPERRPRFPEGVVASADRLRAELAAAGEGAEWGRIERRRSAALGRLEVMERYAAMTRCRRGSLLGYFGEETDACGRCDICRRPARRLRRLVSVFRR
ncbi:MAG TPA: ATP-dependent DNA helicase RecQ [Gemmatimonadales bacterium]|nr:ATP-dependent DNA helicase RecQ [Gemmatimonadales bacterium]